MKTYAAVVGKAPLRRSRSEEFPPLVRDFPLGLSDPLPTERPSPAVGTLQDSPPPADPSAPSRPFLLPQDDPDAILVDNEEDEFAEESEAGDEAPSTSTAKPVEGPRVVVAHITTGDGKTVPVQATEEAAWGATALPDQQEAQYWTYFHRFTELGWDPSDRRVPAWIRDRFLATLREQQQVERELPPPTRSDAPFYAGRRSQWTGKGGFAAYPDPPPSPTPFRRVASVRAPLPPEVVEKRKKKNAARTARRNRAAEYRRQEEEVARAQYRPPSLMQLPLTLFPPEVSHPEPTPLFSSGGPQPEPAPLFSSGAPQPEPAPQFVMAPPPPPPMMEPPMPIARLRPRRTELAVGGAPPPFLPLSGTVSVPPAPSRVRCPVPLPPLPPVQPLRPGGLVAPEFLPSAPQWLPPGHRRPFPCRIFPTPLRLLVHLVSPLPQRTTWRNPSFAGWRRNCPSPAMIPRLWNASFKASRTMERSRQELRRSRKERWRIYGNYWIVSWTKPGPRRPLNLLRNRGLSVPILSLSARSGPSPRFTGPPSCSSIPPTRDEETNRGNAPEDGHPQCQRYGRSSAWYHLALRWIHKATQPDLRSSQPSTSLTLPSPRAYCRNEELNRIRELARRMAAEFPNRYPWFSKLATAPASPDPDRPKTPEWREVSPAPSTADTPPFWAPLDPQSRPASPPCPATAPRTRSPSPEGIGKLVIVDEAETTPPGPVAATTTPTPSPEDEEEDEAAFLTAEEDMDEE